MVEKTVSLLEETQATGRVIVSSFNHDYLRKAKQLKPDLNLGVLVNRRPSNPMELLSGLGAIAYHPKAGVTRRQEIASLRAEGFHVLVWTVNDEKKARSLIRSGASGLFTDYPQRLKDLF